MSAQRSVLVVDDDEQLPGLMVRLLESAGHRVRTATSLPEPLESELSRRGGRFLGKPFAPKALLRLVAEPGGPRVGGDPGDTPVGTGH